MMKKLYKSILLTCCFAMIAAGVFGQTISGNITDENAEALIGVNIIVKGTDRGTITDFNGDYTVEASPGEVLEISYVGFATQEIEVVANQTTLDVSMGSDAAQLDEIVVTGYSSQKKANLTGAVGVVSAKELEARPITNATQALQGQVSGVWINQNSGEPGQDGATINIRGIGTLNNSNPLILVDGIEAPFGNIDPNDIESITVLKDAASAAIYGSRAANGVVLVTTKRGSANQSPTFTYNAYAGNTQINSTPDYIWDSQEFMQLRNEADVNSGNPALYPDAIVNKYGSGPNTNWFDEIFQSAPIQQHNLSVGGGSGKTNFHISLGYLDQDAVVKFTEGSKRYNARLNLDTEVNDQVRFGGSFYISRQESNLDNIGQDGGVLARATRLGPNFPAFTSDGELADRARDLDAIELSTPNVLAEVQALNRILNDNRFLGSFYAEYEPIAGLKVKGTFAANYQTDDDQFFNRRIQTFDWETGDPTLAWRENREFTNFYGERLNLTSWLQATYETSFQDVHNIKLLGGINQESSDFKSFQASRLEIPSNSLLALSTGNPETSTNSGEATQWALRSFFARANYNYDNKYLVEFNVRRDGSSRFGPNNRWAVFPSFSAGWVVSEEDFFSSDLIDFFKIRASWGQLGNQQLGSDYPFAAGISFAPAYSFGGTIVGAAAQTSLGNPDIRWETTTQSDIGFNMSMLNGNLSLEGDYFIRNASDILFNQNNPGVTGVRTPTTVNIAEVQNRGWELFTNYRHKVGKATVTVGGNVTHVVSEVQQIDPNLAGEADRVFDGSFILQRGAPINALYGLEAVGIFQSQAEIDAAPDQSAFGGATPGDLQYFDENGDGVITVDDRKVLGQDNPTWIYGFNLGVEAGGFDFGALFQGIGDAQIFETGRIYAPFANSGGVSAIWRDRWSPQNTDASLPKIRIPGSINSNVNHSWWISDRSYLRLKNIQIGYTLPKANLENLFIKSLRVFVNGTNLWTSTDYVGFDPERQPRDTNAFSSYPQLKIITGGVTLKF